QVDRKRAQHRSGAQRHVYGNYCHAIARKAQAPTRKTRRTNRRGTAQVLLACSPFVSVLLFTVLELFIFIPATCTQSIALGPTLRPPPPGDLVCRSTCKSAARRFARRACTRRRLPSRLPCGRRAASHRA